MLFCAAGLSIRMRLGNVERGFMRLGDFLLMLGGLLG